MAGQIRSQRHEKSIVHADNTHSNIAMSKIDFCSRPDLRVVLHSPYSLDLPPFDYFLFGYIKN
jgi:hypothetical protein